MDDDVMQFGLAMCAALILAVAMAAVLLGGCQRPIAAPGTMPPVAQPAAPEDDAGTGVDPGCAALCARCPQVQPERCVEQCGEALEAADAMLDPQCVVDAVDCDAAVACVR